MKNLKTLFVAAAATIALSSAAHAGVSTTGQTDPSPINASGTIAKYVNFTNMDTSINAQDLGGPLLVDSNAHSAGAIVYPTGSAGGGVAADAAEIEFDANTHIGLTVAPLADLSTTDSYGTYTLPTEFHVEVKGNVTGSINVNSPGAFSGSYLHSNTTQNYVFGHGADSGINFSVKYQRNGLSDHAGIYTTSAALTWADLG